MWTICSNLIKKKSGSNYPMSLNIVGLSVVSSDHYATTLAFYIPWKKLVYNATDFGVMSDIKRIRRLLCVFCFVLLYFFQIFFLVLFIWI